MEKDRIAFKILTATPTGKGLLRRPRGIWKDDNKETGIIPKKCVDLAQDRDYWESL